MSGDLRAPASATSSRLPACPRGPSPIISPRRRPSVWRFLISISPEAASSCARRFAMTRCRRSSASAYIDATEGPPQQERHAKRLPLWQFHRRGERPQRNPPATAGRDICRVEASVAYCLRAAKEAGELSPSLDCDEIAAFIVSLAAGRQSPRQGRAQPGASRAFQADPLSTVLRLSALLGLCR